MGLKRSELKKPDIKQMEDAWQGVRPYFQTVVLCPLGPTKISIFYLLHVLVKIQKGKKRGYWFNNKK